MTQNKKVRIASTRGDFDFAKHLVNPMEGIGAFTAQQIRHNNENQWPVA
jgi:hypothetical protein